MKHKSTIKTINPPVKLPFNQWIIYIKSEVTKLNANTK